MNADRWRQVNALFHQAVELDAPRRDALLVETARTDPQLADEVRSLLARHTPEGGFLEQPAWAVAPNLMFDDEQEGSFIGRQIGSYHIVREIGRGGMGVVYAARDERLGRMVALKALPPQYAANRRHRDRLAREARAAAALTHEAIAMVFALEEIDGALYMASELVEGHTLREEIAHGPMPVERLVPTLIAVAAGLAAAHAHNIIHRDLKPENVIRRADGQIKILDFGLARIDDPRGPTATRLTEPGTVPGTPGYMAPEQLSGGETDARTDLFAFGCVLFEMVTGKKPFEGKTPASLLGAILKDDPPRVSAVQPLSPPSLDRIVSACLAKDLDERYQSARDLLRDLQWAAAATTAESGVARRPRARTEGLAWIVAGVALLALVASSVVAMRHLREAPAEADAIQFTIAPPENATFAALPGAGTGLAPQIAVSPDGRQLVFVGRGRNGYQ
ncbi:MAG TPA: serine/threonine-protein kinase, partial [Vicinamibacterales bacterium]|nr:serine/threonine-protein kinase [Vicinamibacterales bacterium]